MKKTFTKKSREKYGNLPAFNAVGEFYCWFHWYKITTLKFVLETKRFLKGYVNESGQESGNGAVMRLVLQRRICAYQDKHQC